MIAIRVYETKTLALLADFDSEYVPRIGEYLTIGAHLDVGDIKRPGDTTHKVLNVIYQAPWCVHLEVTLGTDGYYLGDIADVDDSLYRATWPSREEREKARDDVMRRLREGGD